MCRELLLLRHAKSAWPDAATDDFERPLKRRGRADAQRVGRWLSAAGLRPQRLLCSPATRTRETALLVATELDIAPADIRWDEHIYEASPDALRACLARHGGHCQRLLLIGHNPGLEQLIEHLAGAAWAPPPGATVFPTAALAIFTLGDSWTALPKGAAASVRVLRPGELDSATMPGKA